MALRSKRQPIDERLLDTAIDHFGRYGLNGASTRAIASAAGTMMSSITYHFGGKQGLYLAAARHIAERITERMGSALASSEAAMADQAGRDEAIAAMLAIVERFAEIMVHPESEPWARFIVREQMDPSEAFDVLFETFGPVAGRVAAHIVQISEGRVSPSDARLRVIAIVGQVLAYRTARAALLRLMDWDEVDAQGVAAIKCVVREHTLAIVTSGLGEEIDE